VGRCTGWALMRTDVARSRSLRITDADHSALLADAVGVLGGLVERDDVVAAATVDDPMTEVGENVVVAGATMNVVETMARVDPVVAAATEDPIRLIGGVLGTG